ncbi:hypothetical protein STEG23_003729 [Scotinomys teguina]
MNRSVQLVPLSVQELLIEKSTARKPQTVDVVGLGKDGLTGMGLAFGVVKMFNDAMFPNTPAIYPVLLVGVGLTASSFQKVSGNIFCTSCR